MIRLETKRKKCVNIVGVGSLPPSIKFDAQCGRLGLRVSFVFIGGAAGWRVRRSSFEFLSAVW